MIGRTLKLLALAALTAASTAGQAVAQECDPETGSPLADVSEVIAAADGLEERIARLQERLHGSGGRGERFSVSAPLPSMFADGRLDVAEAEALLQIRAHIFKSWIEAPTAEEWFWREDAETPRTPWEVDESYLNDVRLILEELGPNMDADARALLEKVLGIEEESTIPEKALEETLAFLKTRPTNPAPALAFAKKLEEAKGEWHFELERAPSGFFRQAFSVEGAPDSATREFAERADASGNGDGLVDLQEFYATRLLMMLETTYGKRATLVIEEGDGENFARMKDGKFEIHLTRGTGPHQMEGVLAHEYGHVVLASLDRRRKSTLREREAEADYFSGWVHGTLGFALDAPGMEWATRRWADHLGDEDHGSFRDRVEVIQNGYRDASGKETFPVVPTDAPRDLDP